MGGLAGLAAQIGHHQLGDALPLIVGDDQFAVPRWGRWRGLDVAGHADTCRRTVVDGPAEGDGDTDAHGARRDDAAAADAAERGGVDLGMRRRSA